MLILRGTADKVQSITGSAADVRVMVSAIDASDAAPPVIQILPNLGPLAAIVTATTTDIVAAAGASTVRNVKQLSHYNAHASVSTSLLVQVTDGTNISPLWSGTLAPGEAVVMDEVGVWTQYDNTGLVKLASGKLSQLLVAPNDVVNATTSFADVTGLTVALKSGKKYSFEAQLLHQTNATTTGAQFGVNIGAAPTALWVWGSGQITSSVTAAAFGSSAAVTAVDTAAVVETTGPGAASFDYYLTGYIIPSADGTFAVRCKSEVAVASGLTVKAGSWLRIRETDN